MGNSRQSYLNRADAFLADCKQNAKEYRLSTANLSNRAAPIYRLPWWPEAIKYFDEHDGQNIIQNGRKSNSKAEFANDIFSKRVYQYFCELEQSGCLQEFLKHKQGKNLHKMVMDGFEIVPNMSERIVSDTPEAKSVESMFTDDDQTFELDESLPSYDIGETGEDLQPLLKELEAQGYFDPIDEIDARKRIETSIVQRAGQGRFRSQLLEAYEGRCAITGCDVALALEAAHILPYKGEHTNDVRNGLLLRADIHTLFDLKKLSVDPENYCVMLAEDIRKTSYGDLHGKAIRLPNIDAQRPDKEALKIHFNEFRGCGV